MIPHSRRPGLILGAAVDCVAGSATFQAATGAADATAALASIVEADGGPLTGSGPLTADGTPIDLQVATCWALVVDSLLPQTRVALATTTVAARVPIELWLRPTVAVLGADHEIPAQRLRWVRNVGAAVAAEVQDAARGTFGPSAVCDLVRLSIPEPEADAFPWWYRATLALDWRSPT